MQATFKAMCDLCPTCDAIAAAVRTLLMQKSPTAVLRQPSGQVALTRGAEGSPAHTAHAQSTAGHSGAHQQCDTTIIQADGTRRMP